jgi:benzil reductase ((S)-benzoin forming)
MTKFAIITGDSRGLGESLAKLFLESGVHVIGISRTNNDQLRKTAEENNQIYKHYQCNLSDPDEVGETFEKLKDIVFISELTTAFLINNAAAVEPMDHAMNIKKEDLVNHIQVNMIAPMLLTNFFLTEAMKHEHVQAIAVEVTSGAGKRPIFGWSTYCSTKAGINMYTETVALEQAELNTGNKVIAFNPGVMDTQMQETIRSKDKDTFLDVERYLRLKEENQLNRPIDVASVLIDILNDEDVINGELYNITNYL